MKYRGWIVCVLLIMGSAMCSQGGEKEVSGAQDVTVITSDHLTYDYSKQYALFEGDVTVVDPKMNLKADIMRVVFDETSDVQSIVAEGHVKISQADKEAEAGKATYEVSTGKISLEDHPRVMRGRDLLEGDTIHFWRDENKMICEPRARLVIFPEKNGTRQKLFGE